MVDTPELDKMEKVQDISQTIGEFIEWLQSGQADTTSPIHRPIFLAAHAVVSEGWDAITGQYIPLPPL